ncbi:uncharacterized protein LOC143465703 isoform X1 [Clavelina lepadiformis]|uniref:uncharacterized protein LOC143465703 isoform X1 n=1 Tax=Clavelina lepadiformis TaxID=159417 RepID=UPI0040423D5A
MSKPLPMASYADRRVLSSENEDSYSTYSEDFDDSRTPTPDKKHRYGVGNRRSRKNDMVTSEGTASSILSTASTKKSIVSVDRRRTKKSSGVKSGWRSTSVSKPPKAKPLTFKDSVQARMLSARNHRINILNNELTEAQAKVEELTKENKLLKNLQHRQDKALKKFEDTESDLPRLISQHTEEQRVLKTRLRKTQENERKLESKLKDTSDELQKMEMTLRRLKKIVYDRNLGERSELAKQLNAAEDKLYDLERKNTELDKKLELTTHSYARQLNRERAKHKDTKERLEVLQDDFLVVQARLKEKERALEVSNIYALRTKQSPEKSFIGGKIVLPSPRQPSEKPPVVKIEENHLPLATFTQTPAILETTESPKPVVEPAKPTPHQSASTNKTTDFRKTIKSPTKIFETEREDSVLLDLRNPKNINDKPNGLNGLLLNEPRIDKDGGHNPRQSVFLTANFESPTITPGSTFISDEAPPPHTYNTHLTTSVAHASSPKESIPLVVDARKDIRKFEEEKKKLEEDRRKKAALLAKMKDLEVEDDSSLPLGDKKKEIDDIGMLLARSSQNESKPPQVQNRFFPDGNPRESFESNLMKRLSEDKFHCFTSADLDSPDSKSSKKSKKQYKFRQEVENLHKGLPSASDLTKSAEKTEPDLTFGSYAPSVASHSKRKVSRTHTNVKNSTGLIAPEETDEPLLDLTSGKSKKSDLLNQLFGEQAAKQSSPKTTAPRETSNVPKTTPRAKPVHTGYPWERNVVASQQGNGDGSPAKDRRSDVFSGPAVKAMHSFNEDDIEEVTL